MGFHKLLWKYMCYVCVCDVCHMDIYIFVPKVSLSYYEIFSVAYNFFLPPNS